MKISKHSHSCIYIEDEKGRILIDPGIYTEEDNSLANHIILKLDYILITHAHSDHLSVSLIKTLQQRFPDVKIISNDEVTKILTHENIRSGSVGTSEISLSPANHEKFLTQVSPCENTLFTVFSRLTHPGDSFDFNSSKEILCLPITAPWGSTTQAVEKALEVKPKIIIPIHDWHWKDKARIHFYKMLKELFSKNGIDFKDLENNEVITC